MVRFSGSLSNERLSYSVRSLDILLTNGLDRNEPHTRAPDGFADSFRIDSVILVALDVRLDKLSSNKFDGISPTL